jgi:hypothetical protein
VARVVAADPVAQVVPVARAVAVVTITEDVVDRVALAARVVPEVPVVPVDRVAPVDRAVAVGSAPVGAETPLVRSASRAVGRPEVESPSAPSVKSSTTWKPRRSAAFGCPGVRVRRFASRAVRR